MSEPLTREPWNGVPLNPERDGWHWIARDGLEKLASWSDRGVWTFMGIDAPPEDVTGWGWAYLGPVLTPSEHRALLDRAEAAEREAHDAHQDAIRVAVERDSYKRNMEAVAELAARYGAERDAARAALQGAIGDVVAERRRQIEAKGLTPEHDDQHADGTLALAAACYALPVSERRSIHGSGVSVWRVLWPWDREWWKPKDRRRDLIRAAALIVAEIERLDRAALAPATSHGE